jgi:hypothetical protein
MRIRRMKRFVLLLGVLVLFATILLAADADGAGLSARCRRPVADAPAGLPAVAVLTTDCGRYRIAPNGRVRFIGPRRLPVPAGSSWFMDLTWYRIDHGRLLVGRRHEFLWRSHGRFAPARGEGVGAVALARTRVAFSFFAGKTPTLYLARLAGAEAPVARGETPLGWTQSGSLLTLSARGGVIRVRAASGRLERTLAHGIYNFAFDHATGTIVYVARGTLVRFDGRRVRTLARLTALNLGGRPSLTPFPGVVVAGGRRRLVALRPDGSLLSSTLLPRPHAQADRAPGALAADRHGNVAFTATDGNSAYGSRGTESIYLLAAGARAARPIYRERVDFAVCERQAELAWHDNWLLYSAGEGYAAAIDTRQPGRSVELSPLIRRLPGMTAGDEDQFFDASWGGIRGV